jgi:hypothetical protein
MGIGVREGRLYRFQVHLVSKYKGILDHGLMLGLEDEEKRLRRVNSQRMGRSHRLLA